MSQSQLHPVAYERLSGGPRSDVEIVLNTRDAPPPRYIYTRDGHLAQMLHNRPMPGQKPRIPKDWQPTPGVTRAIVPATEEWAIAYAEELADQRWEESETTRAEFVDRDELAAVLLMGFMTEVARDGWALEVIPEPPATPADPEDIDPGF